MQLMHDEHGAARNPSSSSNLVSVTTLLTGGLVPSESVNEMTVLMGASRPCAPITHWGVDMS
jgi:hypothetical protein